MRRTTKAIEPKNENAQLKKSVFDKISSFTTIMIPLLTIYFGFIQFLYNENEKDRRKYNNAYYDERFKVIKEINRSIAEINVVFIFNQQGKYDQNDVEKISKGFVNFNYANIIFKPRDSILVKDINIYEQAVLALIHRNYEPGLNGLDSLKDIINKRCRNILVNEKDSTNSFNFKFFPFKI